MFATFLEAPAGNVAPATIPLKIVVAEEDETGSGTTTLEDATLDSLFDPGKDRYIALHSEVEEGQGVPSVISCADVVEAAGGGAGSGDLPETGGPLPAMLLTAAAILALGATGGMLRLVRLSSTDHEGSGCFRRTPYARH